MNFAEQYGPWAVIAGGSEGIGAAFARRFAAEGINLVLLARKPGPLKELADDIRATYGVEVREASVDLTAADIGEQVAALAEGCDVGMLVYNAGAGDHYQFVLDEPLEASMHHVKLNCVGPLTLFYQFGGPMVARKRGGVIFVSGMAGFAGAGGIALYAATKAFENILAEGLWYEMRQHGVHVLVMPAGATDTPAMSRIPVELGDWKPMDPNDVVTEGLEHLADGPQWIPGQHNREHAAAMVTMSRKEMVEAVSWGAASVWGRLDG